MAHAPEAGACSSTTTTRRTSGHGVARSWLPPNDPPELYGRPAPNRPKKISLNITLPHKQAPNPYISPELCFRFCYFALRKMHFLLRARALFFFPGGFGALDELFESLCLIRTRKLRPVPVVLVGESCWQKTISFDNLVDEGLISPEDAELFVITDGAETGCSYVLRWYEEAGEPLVDGSHPVQEDKIWPERRHLL